MVTGLAFRLVPIAMHRRILSRLVIACLACGAAAAGAGPAYWYQWRSVQSGSTVCSRTPLGDGWVQADGPYSDVNCTRRVHLIRM